MRKSRVSTTEGLLARVREATRLLRSSGPAAATKAIQRALNDAGDPSPGKGPAITSRPHEVIDLEPAAFRRTDVGEGRTVSGSVTNAAGTRAYRLYIPGGYTGQKLPLVVMLHGCGQTPDDFAAGTTMDAVAEENDCFVAYPAQAQSANASTCWNWFRGKDQQRDTGEPSIIADAVKQIASEFSIDADRTYVAGLSAGGAMAAIMAMAYPDVFAAAGIHSGLAHGAAHDLPSALQAMQGGKVQAARSDPPASPNAARGGVPLIVFHGDSDRTVHPSNGEDAVEQLIASNTDAHDIQVEKGTVPNGRGYTRSLYGRADGTIAAELWIVHGAGHAWSGGSSRGSYTDPTGPSASREMLRFFLQQRRR